MVYGFTSCFDMQNLAHNRLQEKWRNSVCCPSGTNSA